MSEAPLYILIPDPCPRWRGPWRPNTSSFRKSTSMLTFGIRLIFGIHVDFQHSAAERGGNNFLWFDDFHSENGSSQGQNPALAGLFVPN